MRMTVFRLALFALVVLDVSAVFAASPDDAGFADDAAGADGSRIEASPESADAGEEQSVDDLERTAREARALIAGQLEPTISPESLFEISLADEGAIRVDAARLRAVVHAFDAGIGDSGANPVRWRARVDLDRARLAFYELPTSRRRELLAAHALEALDATTPESPAELRQHEAERQRAAALRSARSARSTAERLVSTELARLLDVERSQAAFGDRLAAQKSAIAERRARTLEWQARASDARAHPGPAADRTYEDLRRALRTARDALSEALNRLGRAASGVPTAGPDALSALTVDVDTSAARTERSRVEATAGRLHDEESRARREQAAQLYEEIDTLNAERLALLPALTSEKRDAITGLTSAGGEQAVAEARQLGLVLRYHRYVIGAWLVALRHPTRVLGSVAAGDVVHVFEIFLAIGAFLWWRRRSPALLRLMHQRADEEDRRARLSTPSPASRTVAFLVQVHRPLEWLLLLVLLDWLLPSSTQQLLEIRVVSTLMAWVFGAALAVATLNAIAGGGPRNVARRAEADATALRLRSLRLIARVVVAFGLILGISSMLVGRGTIYEWVFSTSWVAAVLVLLVLVRWWRKIVFRRIERVRKPTRVQQWVLAKSEGWWTSFAAAAVGGVYLFASGAIRGARNWVGRFVITRRALAYLFRRQLDKREQTEVIGPISEAAFTALGPEIPSADWVATDSDDAIDQLAQGIRARTGGVVAIVGERGMGKSATLRRLLGDYGDALLLDSPSADLDALRGAFARSIGLSQGSFEEAAAALAASPTLHALLVDDAHRFVQPVMGGLATFDMLLAIASRHTSTTTWVFALDEVIWQFLERLARVGARREAAVRSRDSAGTMARGDDRDPSRGSDRSGRPVAELRELARTTAADG